VKVSRRMRLLEKLNCGIELSEYDYYTTLCELNERRATIKINKFSKKTKKDGAMFKCEICGYEGNEVPKACFQGHENTANWSPWE